MKYTTEFDEEKISENKNRATDENEKYDLGTRDAMGNTNQGMK